MKQKGRWLTLIVIVVTSPILATIVWRAHRPPEAFRVSDAAAFEQVASKRLSGPEHGEDPPQWRYFLSDEEAKRIFSFRGGKRYDPWMYYLDKPNLSVRVNWPDHPDGFYLHETNSFGYRDDEPASRADFEIFVVGDSNTAGVCNQNESYSNRLESLLAEARPGVSVSVVNMGTGGYGFYNYVGAVEKPVERAPDVFIVSIFGGNDFLEILQLNSIFGKAPHTPWQLEPEAQTLRMKALKSDMLPMVHCFNSAMTFKTFPDREDLVADVALRLVGEMKVACGKVRTQLVLLYIPEPCIFEWSPPLEGASRVCDTLQIDPIDCEASSRIADRLLVGVRGLGVTTVDLRPVFAALPSPPYWRKDLHMNLQAHELAACALFEALEDDSRGSWNDHNPRSSSPDRD